ncbi:hypothetical protein BGZ51_004556 [Haplosporangium sp. Z 767]|nr:hypothetical protein BGZ51_004556 [Haplosporangium sp. Z 767]
MAVMQKRMLEMQQEALNRLTVIQSRVQADCLRFSDFASSVVSTLQTLHLDYDVEEESKSTRQRAANLFHRFPNLIEATVGILDLELERLLAANMGLITLHQRMLKDLFE